jgi:arylsulfatase A-like enzyme
VRAPTRAELGTALHRSERAGHPAGTASFITRLPGFPAGAASSLLLSAVLATACSKTRAIEERSGAPRPPPSSLPAPSAAAQAKDASAPRGSYNVLLIMIDSLRADMPWAGYPRQIAPWLSRFAERSALYPRAYSISSYTAKSVAPALTGKYPSEMVRDGYYFTRWFPENVFIGERAQQAGHRTLAGHAHGYFLSGIRSLGLDQGFDDYRLLPGTFLDLQGVANITGEALNGLAKEMLSDPRNVALPSGKRFFAYFHFLDPHFTYIKHDGFPDYGKERRDLYDNEVAYSDHWVGDLVSWALAQPWGGRTAVIITADHGEAFGEHGRFRHGYELWEPLIRVPLFIYVPGGTARRVELPRSHIDLAPTIADLLGIGAPGMFRGQSLVPEVLGAKPEPRAVVCDLPRSDLMDRRRALISGDYKLLCFGDDRECRMFNVTRDFSEARELSQAEPEKRAEMKALYAKVSSDIPALPVRGPATLLGAPAGQRW